MDSKKTVIILGASFGGLSVAKNLVAAKGERFNVILVDKRSYLDLNFGSPRVLFKPEDASKLVTPLSSLPWMERCTFVQAVVKTIEKTHVVLQGSDNLAYDICVICTGSAYSNSFCKATEILTADERIAQYKEVAGKVRAAKSALIIGGGFTGMEMAAEAKEAGVESVTMVHSKSFVTNTPEQGKIPLQRLKKIGVNVVLNTKATLVEGHTYRIAGEEKTFDVVFPCFGFTTLHPGLVTPLGYVLTSSGSVDVNASFQVKGYSNIFAIGDAVDVDDDHLAYQAVNHGVLVAKAISKLVSDPNAKLPQWKRNGGFRLAVLVLGPKNVLGLIGAMTCFTFLPGWMNELKIKQTKQSLGWC